MTLLEEALKVQVRRKRNFNISADEVALAKAWVDGRVTIGQVSSAISAVHHGASVYSFLCAALRRYIIDNEFKP